MAFSGHEPRNVDLRRLEVQQRRGPAQGQADLAEPGGSTCVIVNSGAGRTVTVTVLAIGQAARKGAVAGGESLHQLNARFRPWSSTQPATGLSTVQALHAKQVLAALAQSMPGEVTGCRMRAATIVILASKSALRLDCTIVRLICDVGRPVQPCQGPRARDYEARRSVSSPIKISI